MRYDVVAFDVNETLLDVSSMAPSFARALGTSVTVGEWFARLLHRSLLVGHIGQYRSFGDLAVEALLWLAAREGVDLEREEAVSLVSEMTELPPHPDVVAGLEAMAGTRMVALTNGSREAVQRQVAHAGLDRYLERALSVEAVGRFKPDASVYRYAAEVCAVDIGRMLLVAAHDWDVAGAQAAGAGGCFVHRQPWGLEETTPDLEIDDIGGLAAALED